MSVITFGADNSFHQSDIKMYSIYSLTFLNSHVFCEPFSNILFVLTGTVFGRDASLFVFVVFGLVWICP